MGVMDTTTLVAPDELIQRWVEFAQDEQCPDYYELTEYGELVWSPKPTNRHQWVRTRKRAKIPMELWIT